MEEDEVGTRNTHSNVVNLISDRKTNKSTNFSMSMIAENSLCDAKTENETNRVNKNLLAEGRLEITDKETLMNENSFFTNNFSTKGEDRISVSDQEVPNSGTNVTENLESIVEKTPLLRPEDIFGDCPYEVSEFYQNIFFINN